MAYKIPLECIGTAMFYGSSHNRHDLYEYNHDNYILSLTCLKVTPEHSSHVKVAEFDLKTSKFTALLWDDRARSLKQTVSVFLINIMTVFEVEEIEGPPGFMRKWESRMEIRSRIRTRWGWIRNDYYKED